MDVVSFDMDLSLFSEGRVFLLSLFSLVCLSCSLSCLASVVASWTAEVQYWLSSDGLEQFFNFSAASVCMSLRVVFSSLITVL